MRAFRFACVAVVLAAMCPSAGWGQRQSAGAAEPKVVELNGGGWKLGSFPMGEGEKQGAFLPSYNDRDFRKARVPDEVQLEQGLKGMELFYQSKKLSTVNEKEWWYRKQFNVPESDRGKLVRLEFSGVDYYATVWLNGKKLGEHEGAYAPFAFDVSSFLRYGGENTLAVKVTCPWVPKDRGFLEYLKGNWVMPSSLTMQFPFPPYVLGPYWDGVPASGNALLPMGLFRDVRLVVSSRVVIENVYVRTEALNADGSAKLEITGTVKNYEDQTATMKLGMKIEPENFAGESQALPEETLRARPGKNKFEREVVVKNAHLWWTWDLGKQNLYKLRMALSSGAGGEIENQEVEFGIRTIERKADMSYWLNGKRLFLKGAWYASNYFGSEPTPEDYAKGLTLFKAANMNFLVNFTVVEKPAFYRLCDQLGLLLIVELPFPQTGPMRVLASSNPRREVYIRSALGQVGAMVVLLRNHPSIVEWATFAEVHSKERGGGWGVESLSFADYHYGAFSDQVRDVVEKLDPGAIYHPSLCDFGEQHFWMANAGMGTSDITGVIGGNYTEQFNAQAGFISEYGSESLPVYRDFIKEISPEDLWSDRNRTLPEWFNLPINVPAYAYLTSFESNGLFSVLARADQFVDRHIESPQQLVEDSELYQAFLMKYETEAYRRKMHKPINGIRFWAYTEDWPGIHWGIIDYYEVPKMSYYAIKQADARFELNFAYEKALESQVSGKDLKIPVWVVNEYRRQVPVEVRCKIEDLQGHTLWSREFKEEVAGDASQRVGVVNWTTAEKPGVYVLKGEAVEAGGKLRSENSVYIKVTPRLFSKPARVLVIGQEKYNVPIVAMLKAMGLKVSEIKEEDFPQLSELRNSEALRKNYDVVWLASFDSLWKLLDDQEANGLKRAIRKGVGFVETGGPGSFHGGIGHAACLNFTPLEEMLPVKLEDRSDVILGAGSAPLQGRKQEPGQIRTIALTAAAGAGWSDRLLKMYGVPGFNEVGLKPGSREVMSISGRPLLVTGKFGQGRTVAFTGFTPEYTARHAFWDSKIIFPYLVDQEFYMHPGTKAYFELFSRMLAAATGRRPAADSGAIVAAREEPLFEMLKNQPRAGVRGPAGVDGKIDGKEAHAVLNLINGSRFARLVRVRAEWQGDATKTPYAVLYSDNYFDLLPGESKKVSLKALLPSGSQGNIQGSLIVEGTNVAPEKIPIQLSR